MGARHGGSVRVPPQRQAYPGLPRRVETACDAGGVPGRIPHVFRRTAVRNLERAGVPRSIAMEMTGHRTEAVYRRYAIVAEADLREVAGRLDASTR